MANCKNIDIRARLPWTWAEQLPDSEAAMFARLALNTFIGLEFEQREVGYEPNAQGGQTCMVELLITGMEALAWPMLERIVAALKSVGEMTHFDAVDIEGM